MKRALCVVAAVLVLAGCTVPGPKKFESSYPTPAGYESVVVIRCDDRDLKDPSKVACAEKQTEERWRVSTNLAPNGKRRGPKFDIYVCGRQSPDNPCLVPHDTPRGNQKLEVTIYYRKGHNPLEGEPV